MGKRGRPGRQGGSAQGNFNKILSTIPARAEFRITMDADSSVVVYDDIDTNLQDGEAWLVYGGMFHLETTASGAPVTMSPSALGDNNYQLQVHRNDDSSAMLTFLDDDLMYDWEYHYESTLTTSGAQQSQYFAPFRFGHRTITFSEKLRVLFKTLANDTIISLPTVSAAGFLLYDRITAPSIGQSKLGQIADL